MNRNQAQTIAAAYQRKLAAEKELKIMTRQIMQESPKMDRSRFHQLAQSLRRLIKDKQFGEPHEEFLRLAACQTGHTKEEHPRNLLEGASFIQTFHQITRDLWRALENQDTGRGDDGFGDMIDNLPLGPKSLVERLLADPNAFQEIEREFRADNQDIWEGENYNGARLENALCKLLPSWAGEVNNQKPPEGAPATAPKGHTENAQIQIWEEEPGWVSIQIIQYPRIICKAQMREANLAHALTHPGKRVDTKLETFQEGTQNPTNLVIGSLWKTKKEPRLQGKLTGADAQWDKATVALQESETIHGNMVEKLAWQGTLNELIEKWEPANNQEAQRAPVATL
jgi:hypothetical protein